MWGAWGLSQVLGAAGTCRDVDQDAPAPWRLRCRPDGRYRAAHTPSRIATCTAPMTPCRQPVSRPPRIGFFGPRGIRRRTPRLLTHSGWTSGHEPQEQLMNTLTPVVEVPTPTLGQAAE